MFKKTLSVMMSLLLIVCVLAGCSSGTANGDTSGTAEPSASAQPQDTAEGEKTEVEFFNQKPEISKTLGTIIADFQKANPNITVKETVVADSDQVLVSRMASHDIPDIFVIWPNESWFQMVDAGYCMDLTGKEFLGNIQKSALDPFLRDGKNYVVPISYNTMGIWYNVDMYQKAGVEIPKTWDELMANCEKLKAAGLTPFVTSAQTASHSREVGQAFLASMPNYDTFIGDANNATMDVTKPYGADLNRLAEIMHSMIQNSQPDVMGMSYDQSFSDFGTGKGAMLVDGSWAYPSITAANAEIKLGFFPIPGDDANYVMATAYPGDFSISVSSETKKADATLKFVSYLTTKEAAGYYAQNDGSMSCVADVDYVPEHLKYQQSIIASGKYKLNPDVFWVTAACDAFGTACQNLYISGDTKAFAAEVQTAFNDNNKK